MSETHWDRESETLRALYNAAPFEVHVWELLRDVEGNILTWKLLHANPSALAGWGKPLAAVQGKTTDEIFPDSGATARFMPIVQQVFASGTVQEWEQLLPDTGQLLRMISIPLGDRFISCGMDVSHHRGLERELLEKSQQLEKSLQRLKVATRAAQIGIWEYDLTTNTLVWDESMYAIYGVSDCGTELPYETWSQGVHPEDIERATLEVNQAIRESGIFDSEFRIVRKDTGEVRHVLAQAVIDRDTQGRAARMIGVNIDRTARVEAEQQIERLAYFDGLTGIANRALISDRLTQAIAASGSLGRYCALLLIDLDHFKRLNDTAGHKVGDELLIEIAHRLKTTTGTDDAVGRFGGDEFVVLFSNLPGDAMLAARSVERSALKLLAAIRAPVALSSGIYTTTASMGATLFIEAEHDASDALRQADLALHRAKAAGRDTVCFFDPVMQHIVLERMQIEKDLVHAIDDGQLALHYQPQVDLHGQVRGVEALVRWQHPELGALSPAAFIPIAEESGSVRRLGQWVIATALRDFRDHFAPWVTEGFRVAINVSALELHDADFHHRVAAQAAHAGVHPHRLLLEITESALLDAREDVGQRMRSLKALGVEFALDDFGTGHSSLTRLKQLPIDELKVDRSFVADIPANKDSLSIARAVIALADSMAIRVIAEGVETARQRDELSAMGCRVFQGYFFSRPVPVENLTGLLRDQAAF